MPIWFAICSIMYLTFLLIFRTRLHLFSEPRNRLAHLLAVLADSASGDGVAGIFHGLHQFVVIERMGFVLVVYNLT